MVKIEINVGDLVSDYYKSVGVTEEQARVALKAALIHPGGEDWNESLFRALEKETFPEGVVGQVLAESLRWAFKNKVLRQLEEAR